ncbi:MAG TPA: DNA methyltransferase [Bryobacteraceae bacterium]|nr:DNA methyltransferase [Bryobacteraceae bacterium]
MSREPLAATWKNKLFFGDNLVILHEQIPDESVDLVYLDPPFNSNATYNVLFAERSGAKSSAQIRAFDDTWQWSMESELAYHETVTRGGKLADLLQALRAFLGQSDMMAYLVMMAPRLAELHRVLKRTGSLYLHCDPTASHYLKLLMDAVFGPENFRNEIVWKRTSSHGNVSANYGDVIDTLLYYSREPKPIWNQLYVPYSEDHIRNKFTYRDEHGRAFTTSDLRNPSLRPNLIYEYKGYKPHPNGWSISRQKMEQYDREGRLWFPSDPDGRIRLKRYLDEQPGQKVQNLWDDVKPINSQAQERLGYPTQKPEALLERILRASSREGDVFLDPFCGCGTAVHVAEKLRRRWIGIDITHLAITLIRHRLHNAFGRDLEPYEVIGDPKDVESARTLAVLDRYQFEWWALGLVDGRPAHDKKKGADQGIDGLIYFFDDGTNVAKKAVVQVKSGHVTRNQIGDLNHARQREKAEVGVFITLEDATEPMRREACSAGFYQPDYFPGLKVPRIQILTIAELLAGKKVELPMAAVPATFRKAARAHKNAEPQQTSIF